MNRIDHLTKKVWTKVLTNKSANSIKRYLADTFDEIGLSREKRYPFAIFLRSDNGTEFVNMSMEKLYKKYGVMCKQGPAYSPWAQGVVEKVNKTIKDKLKRKLTAVDSNDWPSFVSTAVQDGSSL